MGVLEFTSLFCFGETPILLLLAKGDLPSVSPISFPLAKQDFVGVRFLSCSLSDSELQTGLGILDFLMPGLLLFLICMGLELNLDVVDESFAFLGGLILVGKKWSLTVEVLFVAFSWFWKKNKHKVEILVYLHFKNIIKIGD